MSISPIITFKAGICELDTSSSPPKVKPQPRPGYIYLFEEDDMINFCWRYRSASITSPTLQLVMVPSDGQFIPYAPKQEPAQADASASKINGRIFVLKFQSSSARHLFWLQSRSQHPSGDPAWLSPRDLKLGAIVNRLLQGEEIDVQGEVAHIEESSPDTGEDTQMDDSEAAAASEPRDRNAAGQDSLTSEFLPQQQSTALSGTSLTLNRLLAPSTTLPVIDDMDETRVDELLDFLPPSLTADLANIDASSSETTAAASSEHFTIAQKKATLKKVLRSPQFMQSLTALTDGLRNGGLHSISGALHVPLEDAASTLEINSNSPEVDEDYAIRLFIEGIKSMVQKKPPS